MVAFNFDGSNIPEAKGFEPVPAGEYCAQIVNSDLKQSKNGGEYLSFEFEIIDGQFARRRVFANLTVSNTNPKAEEIGARDIAKIAMATIGKSIFTDTEQLHYKPLKILVAIKPAETINPGTPDEKTFPAKNEVKGFASVNGQASAPAAAPAQPVPPPAAPPPSGGGKAFPWRKSA